MVLLAVVHKQVDYHKTGLSNKKGGRNGPLFYPSRLNLVE
jgi:hypothetical protein